MKKRLLLASLSAAAFGGILSVNAADMPVYTLDQVVVTAARTEEKQIDTNASVSVVTSKQIAQKHFNDVSEALRAVPGVVLGNYSASGQNYSSNKVFINGSSNVVILVDGMRRNTNGVSGSAVNLGTLTDMASIERIEVLKGSASTLYGSDAQGGVINIITKKPKIDEVHTTIGAGFGNNSTEKYTIYNEGKAGNIFWTIDAGKHLQGTYKDGWGRKVISHLNAKHIDVKLGYDLGEGSDVVFNYSKYKSDYIRPDNGSNDTHDDYGTKEQLQAAYGSILRPMDGFRAYEPVAEMPRCIGHDDLMILMFTSGTTGRSKGVMLSERNMCASLHTYSEVAENWITNRLPAGQKLPLSHMTLLPLFHMACFVCVMSYPPAGWALNLCGDIRDFYRDLGLMHSDVMASAPMLVETIYNDFKRGRVSRLNGLWDLCCSSAALDPKMLLELAQNGFVVNQCYGMTETFGDGILNFTQVEKHMSAVGKPDDHVQYKLDETGEICIKGDCVMLGYYKDPEATAEVIDADGWFHTGDLARMDEEGFYYITGRKKNLIILASGENVSPEELEGMLEKCPAVQECIVKELGKKIGVVVYCEKEHQQTVRDFIAQMNRTVPLYKRIGVVEFSETPLPRNGAGKLVRK